MTPTVEIGTRSDRELMAAARRGDADAFRHLIEPHRRELHAHCYRMLGSLHDAEDALQDALLRAWRAISNLEERASLRAWLYRIATNVCLDAIARRPRRVVPVDYGPPAADRHDVGEPVVESVWVEPYPDQQLGLGDGYAAPEARYEQREAVELAFIAALQHLPARQRAALILREVLGFSAREVAELLETTVPSVNSALQRARKAVEERLPPQSQQATMRELGDERIRHILQKYLDAWERLDVAAIAALLAEDATHAMPPYPGWWHGRDAIIEAVSDPGPGCGGGVRLLPLRANGQLASGAYLWDASRGHYVASAITLITLEGTAVKDMTAFLAPELFPAFDLPLELPA
jgi:RNA polymerase sigma-70 factor (ECF subfamily)